MLRFFSRSREQDETRREVPDRLKILLRSHVGLDEEDGLAVNEIACAEACCADLETVILVMRKGRKTEALKLGKPMSEIDQLDVELLAFQGRSR